MSGPVSFGGHHDAEPVEHLQLTLGSGARVYDLHHDPHTGKWTVRLTTWNGVAFKQSSGINIVADNGTTMVANVQHWIGVQAPYAPISEELESRYSCRISRFSASAGAPAEEAISLVGKLALREGDLAEMVKRTEQEAALRVLGRAPSAERAPSRDGLLGTVVGGK